LVAHPAQPSTLSFVLDRPRTSPVQAATSFRSGSKEISSLPRMFAPHRQERARRQRLLRELSRMALQGRWRDARLRYHEGGQSSGRLGVELGSGRGEDGAGHGGPVRTCCQDYDDRSHCRPAGDCNPRTTRFPLTRRHASSCRSGGRLGQVHRNGAGWPQNRSSRCGDLPPRHERGSPIRR